ncbi:hypothetical protein K7432_007601 [Basidiobolus ranarum]|uniref:Peroxisomal membrane protein 11C n=1 Tax=Basidiobolus ranarum TaxID=34480 RepID=A0ABR2WT50_9FUNG
MAKSALLELIRASVAGPNPNLDRLVKLFSTFRGNDKVLMLIQYTCKILTIYFNHRKRPVLASRIANLGGPAADFRVLLRFSGLIPMLQWILAVERDPPASRTLLWVERLQNLSMVLYYPLEHVYWLAAHQIIPVSTAKNNKISLWSCRFWAAYVILQFVHSYEEYRLWHVKRIGLLKKSGEDSVDPKEMEALMAEKRSIKMWNIVNTAYFPMTVHWSLEKSPIPEWFIGVCGVVAGMYQLQLTWESTA